MVTDFGRSGDLTTDLGRSGVLGGGLGFVSMGSGDFVSVAIVTILITYLI